MRPIFLAIALSFASSQVHGHCQIPCGIYHDQMVVQGLREDIETLSKAVNEIGHNSGVKSQDQNQLVRWILNKEKHADKLSDTIVEYFLKQRIKTDADKVQEKVSSAHRILVLTMKVKQSVDQKVVDQLAAELEAFIGLMYPEHHG